ncbi:MAG: hypothetical protein WBL47_05455 [Bacilli bacterium]
MDALLDEKTRIEVMEGVLATLKQEKERRERFMKVLAILMILSKS